MRYWIVNIIRGLREIIRSRENAIVFCEANFSRMVGYGILNQADCLCQILVCNDCWRFSQFCYKGYSRLVIAIRNVTRICEVILHTGLGHDKSYC